jgi:hypothetical protein
MRVLIWLGIGVIGVLAWLDLALAASLSGRTMSELFADVAQAIAGLWKAAMTVIA